jgi:hypothetical protein
MIFQRFPRKASCKKERVAYPRDSHTFNIRESYSHPSAFSNYGRVALQSVSERRSHLARTENGGVRHEGIVQRPTTLNDCDLLPYRHVSGLFDKQSSNNSGASSILCLLAPIFLQEHYQI